MEFYEGMKFAGMENTIHRWKESYYRVRVAMVGLLVFGGLMMLLTDNKKARLFVWIICVLANGFLTFCDIRLHQYIAKGESVLYEEQMKSIDTKRRLEELGVVNYSADFNREMLLMHIPEGKITVSLAFYVIVNGIGLAFFLYVLIQLL